MNTDDIYVQLSTKPRHFHLPILNSYPLSISITISVEPTLTNTTHTRSYTLVQPPLRLFFFLGGRGRLLLSLFRAAY